MTIDEAIKHAEEVAEEKEAQAWEAQLQEEYRTIKSCKECAEEHRQLAEWLKELKQLREQTSWISVTKRLPEDSELVLFSTKTNRVFEGRFFADNTDRQWYAFRDETFAWNNVVIAWMPLPAPYKPQESEG